MSVDRKFNVEITGESSGAVKATTAVTDAVSKAADESARYEAALRQMEIASLAAEQAQRNQAAAAREAAEAQAAAARAAADDSARYQKVLEEMSQKAGPERTRALNPLGDGWMAAMAERRAAITKEGEAGKAAMSEVEAATAKVTLRKEELGRALGQLNRVFPGLGSVARAALNPVTLAIAGAVTVYRAAQQEVERFNNLIKEIDWGGYAKGAAAASAEVNKVRDAADKAAQASERMRDVFEAQQSAQEKLDAARRKRDIAEARLIEDPLARAKAELEIEEHYERRRLERENRGRQFRIEAQQARANELRESETRMGKEISGIEMARRTLPRGGDSAVIEKDIEEARNKVKIGQAERMKLVDEIERYKKAGLYKVDENGNIIGMANSSMGIGAVGDETMAERYQNAEATAKAESIWRQYEQAEAGTTSAQRNVDKWSIDLAKARAAEKRLGVLRPAYEDARASRQGIEAMIPTQITVAGIHSRADQQAYQIDMVARGREAMGTVQKEYQDLAAEAAKLAKEVGTAGNIGKALEKAGTAFQELSKHVKKLEEKIDQKNTQMVNGRNW